MLYANEASSARALYCTTRFHIAAAGKSIERARRETWFELQLDTRDWPRLARMIQVGGHAGGWRNVRGTGSGEWGVGIKRADCLLPTRVSSERLTADRRGDGEGLPDVNEAADG